MDANGDVTEMNNSSDKDKSTVESHTGEHSDDMLPLYFTLSTSSYTLLVPSPDNAAAPADKDTEELADLFKGLSKKKKSKKPKDSDAATAETTNGVPDGEFDPSALKKKKKTKSAKAADPDDFDAKLAEAGIAQTDSAAATTESTEPVEAGGDLEKGTGIWQHSCSQPINYSLLLSRFFTILQDHHPDLLSSGSKSYKIPPPQCLREGNKKTIFANIADICKRIKREDQHVTQFLFAELGTNGSVDGSRRLVIKGRFQQKQIENVLRRYIGKTSAFFPLRRTLPSFPRSYANSELVEYVTCKTCRSPDTELSKGENRLYFVTCNSCGSRRSVTAIKIGFSAQVGKRKRQQV